MDYLRTTKPRVTLLFLLLTAASAVLASGRLDVPLLAGTLLGLGSCVAGAGALNNYIERRSDSLMERTRGRPLPAGRLDPARVLSFGAALLGLGLVVLVVLVGRLPALFAAAGASFYLLVYTVPLKRHLVHGVVPGGLAGVFPALVGWSATGEPASVGLLLLCVLVFLWSPAHFWALDLVRCEEYRAAGFLTLTGVRGATETKLQICLYLAAMTSISLLPAGAGLLGQTYLLAAVVGGGVLGLAACVLWRSRGLGGAQLLYKLSGPYLALLLAAMIIDRLAGTPPAVVLWEALNL
jgi:heme o synthase